MVREYFPSSHPLPLHGCSLHLSHSFPYLSIPFLILSSTNNQAIKSEVCQILDLYLDLTLKLKFEDFVKSLLINEEFPLFSGENAIKEYMIMMLESHHYHNIINPFVSQTSLQVIPLNNNNSGGNIKDNSGGNSGIAMEKNASQIALNNAKDRGTKYNIILSFFHSLVLSLSLCYSQYRSLILRVEIFYLIGDGFDNIMGNSNASGSNSPNLSSFNPDLNDQWGLSTSLLRLMKHENNTLTSQVIKLLVRLQKDPR